MSSVVPHSTDKFVCCEVLSRCNCQNRVNDVTFIYSGVNPLSQTIFLRSWSSRLKPFPFSPIHEILYIFLWYSFSVYLYSDHFDRPSFYDPSWILFDSLFGPLISVTGGVFQHTNIRDLYRFGPDGSFQDGSCPPTRPDPAGPDDDKKPFYARVLGRCPFRTLRPIMTEGTYSTLIRSTTFFTHLRNY